MERVNEQAGAAGRGGKRRRDEERRIVAERQRGSEK